MAGEAHVANNEALHCEQRSPLIRPNGHLLPRGEKGGIDDGEIRRKPEISNLVLSR